MNLLVNRSIYRQFKFCKTFSTKTSFSDSFTKSRIVNDKTFNNKPTSNIKVQYKVKYQDRHSKGILWNEKWCDTDTCNEFEDYLNEQAKSGWKLETFQPVSHCGGSTHGYYIILNRYSSDS